MFVVVIIYPVTPTTSVAVKVVTGTEAGTDETVNAAGIVKVETTGGKISTAAANVVVETDVDCVETLAVGVALS